MRVNIFWLESGAGGILRRVPDGTGVDIAECLPDETERAEALRDLLATGVHTGGGGAAVAFELVSAEPDGLEIPPFCRIDAATRAEAWKRSPPVAVRPAMAAPRYASGETAEARAAAEKAATDKRIGEMKAKKGGKGWRWNPDVCRFVPV